MTLVQMCVQGLRVSDSSVLTLPNLEKKHIDLSNQSLAQLKQLRKCGVGEVTCLAEVLAVCELQRDFVGKALLAAVPREDLKKVGREYEMIIHPLLISLALKALLLV